MSLSELLVYVTPAHRPEVERRYMAFAEGMGALADEHIDSFAKVLNERGYLTTDGLHEFLTYRSLMVGPLDVAPAALRPDRGRYELMTLLAKGGMGEVFLGTEATLKRTVALKRLQDGHRDDPAMHRRFVTEARITAQLDHPAIVPIYGFESDAEGTLVYAMKFVRGVTLTEFIDEARVQIKKGDKADGRHSLKARVETFVPVLNALAYAHRRGVIHRDLKPDNIMVGRFGEVLVMDWGVARILGATAASRATILPEDVPGHPDPAAGITRVGAILGTPDFMSPEQARGEELEPSADQYSLGLILQELVTLEPAVSGDDYETVHARALKGDRDAVTDTYEEIPRELRAIIAKASSPDKHRRYASVEAMADDVRRFLRDESVEADPDAGLRRIQRWVGAHRGAAVSAGLGLVLAIVVVAAVVVWRGQVALEAQRAAAQQRERSISVVGAAVDAQAKRMTEALHGYERQLEQIATSARVFLTEPAPEPATPVVAYQYTGGERDPEAAPADAVDSAAYHQKASLRHADVTVAAGIDREAMRPRLNQLVRLEPILRETIIASTGDSKKALPDAERAILDKGAPLAWVYFASADGAIVGMPGTWDYDDTPGAGGYDHRKEPWYLDAVRTSEPFWSADMDENGLGLLLGVTETVYDGAGRLIGVAALDLAMAHFIVAYLAAPALAGVADPLLLDREGRVQVRASDATPAPADATYSAPMYEEPLVVAGVRASASGHVALSDGRLAFWSSLGKVGLVYVVIGREEALLAAIPAP